MRSVDKLVDEILENKPILVGEDNPLSRDPRHALYPYPPNCAGARLQRILGLSAIQYLHRFDRRNLCSGRWDWGEAGITALALRDEDRPLVLLGSKVAKVFLRTFHLQSTEPFTRLGVGSARPWFFLPHPSGRCLAWNDEANIVRARKLLEEYLR